MIYENYEFIQDSFNNLETKFISPSVFKQIFTHLYMDFYQISRSFTIYSPKNVKNLKFALFPVFPINTWNLYKRVLENLPRSNKRIEAWHKVLAQHINSQPETNKLINHLIKKQHLVKVCLEQIKNGTILPRDQREIKRDEQIIAIAKTFKDDNFMNYLNQLTNVIFL
ncbi:ac transposable element-derived 3 [Brachionus plicatilis]|uniref:Ac transposable element-derived 3 n=1 Tax=Brachionus plicatilis TaxID=10195 RepID=A0A3M7PYW6_BRAPC|nr:ac transposable element-derived 3 [Brachionus plicatilis]